jgi:hypothetical protein
MELKVLRLRNDTTCGYEVYDCITHAEARRLYRGLKQNSNTLSVDILTVVTDHVVGHVVKPFTRKETSNDSYRRGRTSI